MSDESDRIIYLAQELLKHNTQSSAPALREHERQDDEFFSKKDTLKAIGLAAFVAVAGTGAITQTLHEAGRPVSRYERVEIEALIFYAARQENRDESAVRQEVQALLNLPLPQNMSVKDYRQARKYLRDRISEQAQ